MLDPRYKDVVFSSGDRAFELILEELEKIQENKQAISTTSNNPIPTKRAKTDSKLNFMAMAFEQMDERRRSIEEPMLKVIEDVSLNLVFDLCIDWLF